MSVERWDEAKDGVLSERAMREKLERRGYCVSLYVYAPGTYFAEHAHGIDKIDAVLAGRFRIVLEGEEVILEAGDAVFVRRFARHSAEVIGNEAVISLDATKA